MTSMYRYLDKVNPELAKRYQRERWHSGTTGWGHDCPSPANVGEFTKVSHGFIDKHIEEES